jgi:hypothetical protein
MNRDWERLASPVESLVACGPNRHRLRWQDGVLTAVDHRGDPDLPDRDGEEMPECSAVCAAWQRHREDPRVLVLGARHPGDPVRVSDETLARLREEPGADPADLGLLRLLGLDPLLQRRLHQQVAAHLASSVDPSDRATLEAATTGRLRPVLDRWAGRREWETTLTATAGGAYDPRRPLAVGVGPEWLAEVWGNHLAVVSGHLVFAVTERDRRRTRVTALPAPGRPLRPLVVKGPAPWRALLDVGDEP